MKYFKGIYDFLNSNSDKSYQIKDDDYELLKKEEKEILKQIGYDFKNKYYSTDALHDCPTKSINMDFYEQKNNLQIIFLHHENRQPFSIIYKDIYDCKFNLHKNFIIAFNSISGKKCIVSEFSNKNNIYTHEMAFCDGSQIVINFRNPKNLSINI